MTLPDIPDLEPTVSAADLAAGEPTTGVQPDGSVALRVPMNLIIDQVHQQWAAALAQATQRNAELAAALTVTQDELTEVRGKLAALQQVTNAPDEPAA